MGNFSGLPKWKGTIPSRILWLSLQALGRIVFYGFLLSKSGIGIDLADEFTTSSLHGGWIKILYMGHGPNHIYCTGSDVTLSLSLHPQSIVPSLKERFSSLMHPNSTIVTSAPPWTSVCRGRSRNGWERQGQEFSSTVAPHFNSVDYLLTAPVLTDPDM